VSPEAETPHLRPEFLDDENFQPILICFMSGAFSLPLKKLNNKITNQPTNQ
jgi:hypothetical protein